MRNSIYTNNFNNQNALMKTNNQPVLNDAQINDAKLVKKLPSDFPIADWESMNTKAQLKAMQHSGLSDKEQWALLNTTAPLSALNQHNQAQSAVETRATAAKIATTLMSATTQAAIPRAPVTASKPTNSTPLQTTAQQRKLDMEQEEYETRFYEKQARRPIAVNAQNNTPKTPAGAKPVVDSRDAMEQKKDKVWDKIAVPTWREKREDEIWGQVNGKPLTYPVKLGNTPLPQPGATPFQTPNPYQDADSTINPEPQPLPYPPGVIPSIETYDWYSSYENAAKAWAKENVSLSKDLERCAIIYKNIDENGNERFTFTKSYYGMDEIPFLGIRPNVVIPFTWLRYLDSGIPESEIAGFIHSHPNPPSGSSYSLPSKEDLSLYKYGIDQVTVVPYETGTPTTYALKPSK